MSVQTFKSKAIRYFKPGQRSYSNSRLLNYYHLRMTILMLLADISGISLAIMLIKLLNGFFQFTLINLIEADYWAIGLALIFLFFTSPLYPGVGVSPDEEMKRVIQYVSMSFTIGLVLHSIMDSYVMSETWAIISIGVLSFFTIIILRWSIRILSVQLGWWGEPVIIFSHHKRVNVLTDHFLHRYRLGFIPSLIVTDEIRTDIYSSKIPIISIDEFITDINDFEEQNFRTVLIDIYTYWNNLPAASKELLINRFHRIIFVSETEWVDNTSIHPMGLEGLFGIEAQITTFRPLHRFVKRGVDVILALILSVLSLPIFLLIALFIWLEGTGPVFYTQQRLGYQGSLIKIYKFRTMQMDADYVLAEYLRNNPNVQREWQENQKLANDPRITRVGKWLRKFSLDELPQLVNVLKGEMSLVGPRPMIPNQIKEYGEKKIAAYHTVLPGLTGLWQVSGRNLTTFQERARFDLYYIRYWSFWLDLYILMRTIWVVLTQYGAW